MHTMTAIVIANLIICFKNPPFAQNKVPMYRNINKPTYHIVRGVGRQKEDNPNHAFAVLNQLLKPIKQSNADENKNNGQIRNNRLFIKSRNVLFCKSYRVANKNPD